jgi:hypothetical protein
VSFRFNPLPVSILGGVWCFSQMREPERICGPWIVLAPSESSRRAAVYCFVAVTRSVLIGVEIFASNTRDRRALPVFLQSFCVFVSGAKMRCTDDLYRRAVQVPPSSEAQGHKISRTFLCTRDPGQETDVMIQRRVLLYENNTLLVSSLRIQYENSRFRSWSSLKGQRGDKASYCRRTGSMQPRGLREGGRSARLNAVFHWGNSSIPAGYDVDWPPTDIYSVRFSGAVHFLDWRYIHDVAQLDSDEST